MTSQGYSNVSVLHVVDEQVGAFTRNMERL